MILLLALPVLAAVAVAHRWMQGYAPSNVLARRVRASRPRLSTALMLMALADVLLLTMKITASATEAGAPGWLNAVVLILAWDTIKVALLAAVCAARGVRRVVHLPAGSF